MSVLIIDYGMGNLASVQRALEECGASALISATPQDLRHALKIILPGVGAFREGMANLRQQGWDREIQAAVKDGVPLLGICLGMQLLLERGQEGGDSQGLGLLAGTVKSLNPSPNERLPHVGWNEVHQLRPSLLLQDIPDQSDFYFVHSYQVVPDQPESAVAITPYAGGFVSVIEQQNVFGTQFHPEKSSKMGFQLLKNFLAV